MTPTEQWEELTRDFKYVAIKKWEEFQSETTTEFIFDYLDKEWDDEDYAKLSLAQRYILDGLRRQRGKLRKNLPSRDLANYTIMSLRCPMRERSTITKILVTLYERRFLILTNEQDKYLKYNKVKNSIIKNRGTIDLNSEKEENMVRCEHDDNAKYCEKCKAAKAGKSPIKPDSKSDPKPKSSKIKPFPFNVGIENIEPEEVERVLLFHWKYNVKNNPHWRDSLLTPYAIRNSFPTMQKQAEGFVAKPPAMGRIGKMDCEKCHGAGVFREIPKGKIFLVTYNCNCSYEVELHGPEWNEWMLAKSSK
jgi:hypothetical protein